MQRWRGGPHAHSQAGIVLPTPPIAASPTPSPDKQHLAVGETVTLWGLSALPSASLHSLPLNTFSSAHLSQSKSGLPKESDIETSPWLKRPKKLYVSPPVKVLRCHWKEGVRPRLKKTENLSQKGHHR